MKFNIVSLYLIYTENSVLGVHVVGEFFARALIRLKKT